MVENIPKLEGDWLARQFFSATDLEMSPEEYAAHHAHEWGCFSLHHQRFCDVALGAWVCRFGEILDSEAELNRCQAQYLSAEEKEQIRRLKAEPF